MDLSQLIVLRLGQGDGLWWEVEQVRTTQPAGKLVLLVPGGESDVVARLNEHLPSPVPPDELGTGELWISAVVVFDDSWMPRVFPVGLRRKGLRGWMWRVLAVETSTSHVAFALKNALASVGRRQRTMVLRSRNSTHAAVLAGAGLAVVLALAGLLGYRALQLTGIW